MDPVSHVAFGRTLIALDSGRRLGPGAIAACLAGSLTPDLDAVFMPIGWDIYLLRHQGGTHSLIGSLGCAALTAAAIRLRWKSGNYRSLVLAAWAGAVGHLVLDLISGADLRLLWPVGPRVAAPLFAMADPWLGGILLLGIAALVLRRCDQRLTASVVLVTMAIFTAGKVALYARARALNNRSDSSVQSTRADVEWGSLARWIVYEARADTVTARRVNAVIGTVTPLLQESRGLQDPLVMRSPQLDTVRNFLAAHDITFAIVSGDRQRVLWSDLRYCGPVRVRSAPWAPPVLTNISAGSCALWVGGEFDPPTGVPLSAVVYIGQFVQRRPVH
jgi:membrane-bound metal-dependent hydrolase YbcI (DUF457 family)